MENGLKIMLVNPPTKVKLRGNLERFYIRSGSRWPTSVVKKTDELCGYRPYPFYLSYAAGLLKANGFEVYCYDGCNLNHSQEEFLHRATDFAPDILFFESFHHTASVDHALCNVLVKQLCRTQLVTGGPNAIDLDFVQHLDGEYELSLLNNCLNGAAVPKPIYDLNRLPRPAYEDWPETGRGDPTFYWDGFCQYKPAVQMHSSRGCPFRCNFCMWNQVMYKESGYRTFEPDRVIDEAMFLLNEYKPNEIYFDDDTFTGNIEHTIEMAEKLGTLGVYWSAMADFMIINHQVLTIMAKNHCIGLKFGVESAVPEVLKAMGKPIDLDRVMRMARTCNKLGIRTHATFSFGHANDTPETIEATMKYAEALPVDTVQFSIVLPYPGTRLYRQLECAGRIKNCAAESYDLHSYNVIDNKELDNDYLRRFFECAPRRWLLHKLVQLAWCRRQVRYFSRGFRHGGWENVKDDIVKGVRVALGL